jgi:lysophospholipase L1-like esterase
MRRRITILSQAGGPAFGDIDLQNHIITNIGAAGTDFTATGGLTLADYLDADSIKIQGVNIDGDHLFPWNLRDWNAQIAKIITGTASSQAIIVVLGDSWVNNTTAGTIANDLKARFGDAGVGWIDAVNYSDIQLPGVTVSRLGTWVDVTKTSAAVGVDLSHTTSLDVATPGSYSIAATANTFKIHYLKQAGGGTFTWSIDGGAATSVNTSNATTVFATTTISSLTSESHTLAITVTVAGTAGVTIMGVDAQRTQNGVRVHLLRSSGSETATWTQVNATIWEAGITALAPNLVGIMLGMNDCNHNVVPATYKSNLSTLATRALVAMPYAGVMLVGQGDAGFASTYPMTDYLDQEKALARSSSYAFVNVQKRTGTYAESLARGLQNGTAHFGADGYRLLAETVTGSLLQIGLNPLGNYSGISLFNGPIASTRGTIDAGAAAALTFVETWNDPTPGVHDLIRSTVYDTSSAAGSYFIRLSRNALNSVVFSVDKLGNVIGNTVMPGDGALGSPSLASSVHTTNGIYWGSSTVSIGIGAVSGLDVGATSIGFPGAMVGGASSYYTAGTSAAASGYYRMPLAGTVAWMNLAGTGVDTISMQAGANIGSYFNIALAHTLTHAVTDARAVYLSASYTGAYTITRYNYFDMLSPSLAGSAVITDATVFRFDDVVGTHKALGAGSTKTTPGTVDGWMKVNVNGTLYYVPMYTSTTA